MNEHSPEADKLSECVVVWHEVNDKGSRIVPSAETQISILASTSIDTDAKENEADHCDNLDHCKPELKFAVKGDRQEVQSSDYDPKDANENAYVEIWCPVLDYQATSSELECVCYSPGEPIDPAHGKTKTLVDKSTGICGEGSRYRNVSCHLAQGDHDAVDQSANECIGN